MKRTILALTVAILATIAPMSAQAGDNHAFGQSEPVECGDNGTVSWTPTTLWPPNHKLRTITVTYNDPDGGTSTLTVTTTNHSDVVGGEGEEEELNGSGNTEYGSDSTPDAGTGDNGTAVAEPQARAERSGHSKLGRTYTFHYVATNDNNTPGVTADDDGCSSMEDGGTPVTVAVPHDCRNGACRP